MTKTAVILLQLGGPDKAESIKPFLFNFFMDKNIIGAPKPIRWMLAKLISNKRSKTEAGDSYGELGGGSPLLANTQAQADALQASLPEDHKVFVCMRYWHPMAPEVIEQVKAWGADRVVLLPLYPQLSTATSYSSVQDWQRQCGKLGQSWPTSVVCCYPWQAGYVEASVDNIRIKYHEMKKTSGQAPRVLFSAHGLPEITIKRGDPYQWQCEQSMEHIVKALDIPDLDYQICYQSRVGPLKWIGPSLDEALEKAAGDKVPVVIYPHAFVSEHVETLVELDIEYREMAEELGIHHYARATTVSTHPAFIKGLAEMVAQYSDKDGVRPDTGERLCPKGWKKCGCKTIPPLLKGV